MKISVFKDAYETTPMLGTDVSEVLNAIRTGGRNLKGRVERYRKALETELKHHGDHKRAKKATQTIKNQLPAVTWSGTFTQRANDQLSQHSGLLCADCDKLNSALPKVRDKLRTSPYLFASFVSPSGDGLKAVFRVPADPTEHAASFRAVQSHVHELCGVEIDQACKDVARLCFLSFDPELYYNPNATGIEPLPEPEKPPRNGPNSAVNLSERQRIAVGILGSIEWISPTEGYCDCPNKAAHTAGDGKRDCKVWVGDKPSIYCFHDSCRGVIDGLNHVLRSRIGKAEYQFTQAGDNASEVFTSLSSLEAVEYPAPPAEAAYYGLAGDIIRRIEPHTEADPAALLIQFLVEFGNIIGRTAYVMADGARHYCNMNAVVVGPTSKARKGTAKQRVRSITQHVDQTWAKNCMAQGLSSGEGLICAVRDEMVEKKPIREKGRFTGEYETVVTDHGVSDKRLLVSETEFASPLKVMRREGNTLSPVIRNAWDDGNLRTLTKNSPIRATDAHVSIIGHITRHEARRELTETESANGFGNRIIWCAATRSKCLPEGGDSFGISDLVERLQNALKFAQTAGELKRDDQARKLWAQVYPVLSEGKPGLLGALTARAEAQVLRLSANYALLDCSNLIKVEHLKAALASWDYSERSAQWIFETGTGNKNADRILAALKVAGEKGLTKWQITNEVFNRHATKFEIDEGLRLLHTLKLAIRTIESTATRSAERWFYKPHPCEVCEESTFEASKTEDTSHSSHPQPTKNTNSGVSEAGEDKEGEL